MPLVFFNRDCTEPADCLKSANRLGCCSHVNSIDSSNLRTWSFFLSAGVSSPVSFISILQFLEYRSSVSQGRFILRYFIVFHVMVNGIVSLIPLFGLLFLVYRNTTYVPSLYLWLIYVDVWRKPTQFCKTIILQLKKIKIKKRIRNRFMCINFVS